MNVGQKVFDRVKRRVGYIERIEDYPHIEKMKWYVVKYRDGFVRNCHTWELRILKEKKNNV